MAQLTSFLRQLEVVFLRWPGKWQKHPAEQNHHPAFPLEKGLVISDNKGPKKWQTSALPKESNMFRYVYEITMLKPKPQSLFTELKNNGDSQL